MLFLVKSLKRPKGPSDMFWHNKQHDTSVRVAFTLFEVLLVLALLSVMATMVYPSISRWQCEIKLEQTADEVRDFLHGIRLTSIQSGVPLIVEVSPEENRINCVAPPGITFRKGMSESMVFALPGEIHFLERDSRDGTVLTADQTLHFRPDGTASAAMILLGDSDNNIRRLKLYRLTGSVRVEQ